MTDYAREKYYDALIAALRVTLMLDSGDTGTRPNTETAESNGPPAVSRPFRPGSHWVPYWPRGADSPSPLAPTSPSWDGFHFVDIARLGDAALIAFRWRETGDEIFVYVYDLGEFGRRSIPADFAAS